MVSCSKGSRGFSLIEVLVAIVIFSVGMLGLLGLTSNGLMMTYMANYTTTGAQLAYALADNVRANPTQLASYDDPDDNETSDCFSSVAENGCDKNQIVQTEVNQWRETVARALPGQEHLVGGNRVVGGDGVICRDASPTDGTPEDWLCDPSAATSPYVVKVCWSNRIGGGWSCYRVVI